MNTNVNMNFFFCFCELNQKVFLKGHQFALTVKEKRMRVNYGLILIKLVLIDNVY